MNIIERMRAGELILETDPDYPKLRAEFEKTMSLVGELNSRYHTPDEIRALLAQIWGQEIDPSVHVPRPRRHNTRRRCVHRPERAAHNRKPPRAATKEAQCLRPPHQHRPQGVDRRRGNHPTRSNDRRKLHCGRRGCGKERRARKRDSCRRACKNRKGNKNRLKA